MLFKLSLANIKKSFKDYAIYFFTLILGVCIFYIFNSLDSQTAMLKVSSNTGEIIGLLLTLLSGVSVFVSFILGFLIIYASRFLIKKRNKEFGIYLTLGMSKRKISFLLLLETLIIGIISLVVGLIIGIFLSQIASVFIANLFEVNMDKYTFIYSNSAFLKTILYFGIIYLIVMLFNTIVISRCKLIDLINSSKKQEKIKIKNPIISAILCLLSIGILSFSYYMVTKGLTKLMDYDVSILLVPIGLGCLGTFLFFYSITGLLFKIINKFKKVYFNKLNSFTFKQISSKINTMVMSISVICILLFLTICILSSALSIKNYFNKSITTNAPADFEIELIGLEDFNAQTFYEENGIYSELKNLVSANIYKDENFTLDKSLGNQLEEMQKKYPYVLYDTEVEIMLLSDYNKLADIFHMEKINLKEDEYAIVSNYEREIYDKTLETNSNMNIFGKELKPYSNKTTNGFYMMSGNPTNIGFFVVSNSVLKSQISNHYLIIGNYKSSDTNYQIKLNDKFYNLNYITEGGYSFTSKLSIKDSCVGLSAIVTFIGLYLGIIFLITSAAILALKQLSDALDDKGKYIILRKIGTSEKMINKALFTETFVFFMTPLFLAIIHTIFGIKFAMYILSSIGINKLTGSIITTSIFIILIYGGYFIVTYMCSKNIIKDK